MLTLQKTGNPAIISIPTADKLLDELLDKEWLLTNNRGSYASSTIIGCNTRRYHGLLIGSLNPPVNRIMALADCLEMVILNGQVFNLSTFEFSAGSPSDNGKFAPEGFRLLKRFRRDIGVHFDYQLPQCQLTKSVYLLRNRDMIGLLYDFTGVQEPAEFILRPFIGIRDFHTLQKSYAHIYSNWIDDGLLIRHDTPNSCELFLSCTCADFEKDEQWWFNFVYRNEQRRGQEFTEDLWTPGFFRCQIETPTRIVFWANLSNRYTPEQLANTDIDAVCEDLHGHQESIKHKAKSINRKSKTPNKRSAAGGLWRIGNRVSSIKNRVSRFEILCLAADQFVVTRELGQRATILAGFPWFADWGRDALIALPGLLLATGRFDEAKSVLSTFAAAADKGMIPNRFDDNSDTVYFNSIDASLWFINAAFQYLNATNDSETFTLHLLPTIRWIVDSYYNGTRFGIHADVDGLITAGDEQTQLTWMDAKYAGEAFTPRYGKAVEINALWYNGLCRLAQFYTDRDINNAKHYRTIADKVAASFCELFWNEKFGYLNDCVLPDGSVDATLRPNQIFAVSLPFSPLPLQQQKCVVNVVQEHLLTPYGLRTLNTGDNRYKGVYAGPQRQRDEAYHQGTVWPYLLGPFVESYLKVNKFSRKSKRKASEFIEPLLRHLTEDGCIGQICEIFDGDAPHKPKGCIAQAWSVAELIRAYNLING